MSNGRGKSFHFTTALKWDHIVQRQGTTSHYYTRALCHGLRTHAVVGGTYGWPDDPFDPPLDVENRRDLCPRCLKTYEAMRAYAAENQ